MFNVYICRLPGGSNAGEGGKVGGNWQQKKKKDAATGHWQRITGGKGER